MKLSVLKIAELIRDLQARDILFRTEISAAEISAAKAGGTIAVIAEPESYLSLKELSFLINEKQYPFFVMGAMSNTLVSDEGFPFAVSTKRLRGIEIIGDRVYVGGGESLQNLVTKTAQYGLKGLEVFAGIPASVGGAVFMNAGCYGKEIKDYIESVSLFDFDLLRGGHLDRDQMDFSYRKSGLLKDRELVLGVEFKLEKDIPQLIKARIEDYRKMRREAQPQEPSFGSTFLKTEGSSAGFYIDKAGLKGLREGGFEVSEKHANFFVNRGEGTAEDFVNLVGRVKEKVLSEYGVKLKEEVRFV